MVNELGFFLEMEQVRAGKNYIVMHFSLLNITIGVGKGRQMAAIILDNLARGRNKHVWYVLL